MKTIPIITYNCINNNHCLKETVTITCSTKFQIHSYVEKMVMGKCSLIDGGVSMYQSTLYLS